MVVVKIYSKFGSVIAEPLQVVDIHKVNTEHQADAEENSIFNFSAESETTCENHEA